MLDVSGGLSGVKIVSLIVLAVLLLTCFLSDQIAGWFVQENEEKQKRVSLIIKGGALAVAALMFLMFFL